MYTIRTRITLVVCVSCRLQGFGKTCLERGLELIAEARLQCHTMTRRLGLEGER